MGQDDCDKAAGEGKNAGGRRRPCWARFFASIILSAASFEMFVLYGIVHWRMMFQGDPPYRPPRAVFTVLGHLGSLQVISAVLAVGYAIWFVRGAPKWARVLALVCAIFALMTCAVIT